MDWKEHGVKIVHAGELDMSSVCRRKVTQARQLRPAILELRPALLALQVSAALKHSLDCQIDGATYGDDQTRRTKRRAESNDCHCYNVHCFNLLCVLNGQTRRACGLEGPGLCALGLQFVHDSFGLEAT
jgi:hypothetical protein